MSLKCPKCKTTLRRVTEASILSGLAEAGNSATIVTGETCWKCGKWVEDDIDLFVPVCPMPSLERSESARLTPKGMTSKQYGATLLDAIRPFFNDITKLREKEIPMSTIVARLKIPVTTQTCSRYYVKLCAEYDCGIPNMRKFSRINNETT